MVPTLRLLDSLVAELDQHPVNTNVFFQAFKDQYLQRGQLELFLKQYRYFCKHFVKLLEGLLYKTPVDQIGMRIELVKTLHSELGSGRSERAHVRLLDRFANALGLSEAELDLLVGKFFRGYWSVLDGFLPLPWRRRWHGGALAMLAAYETIRLTRGERQPAPRQAAE